MSAVLSLDEQLELAVSEVLEADEARRPLERETLLARYPEVAEELAAFLEAHTRMARVAAPLRQSVEYLVQRWDVPQLGATSSLGSEVTLDLDANSPISPERAVFATPPSTATHFGDYELLEELGRGGMGVVFKARHVRLKRVVALKMVLAGRFADSGELDRFRAEALTAAGLDHPGIVPIYEAGEVDGLPYFSMGYIEGTSLADRLREGALPPQEAVRLLRKIAAAVAYAHVHGVIHRDLKPANILLARGDDGRLEPKITDFGLARRMDVDSRLTTTGQVLGTPSYMPPEQAAGRPHEAGAASDIYSLGAILYALVTGRPPFLADNPMEVLLQVLEKDPPSLRTLKAGVPPELEWICLKCLEKREADRYPSAAALAEDLDRFLRQEPPEARAGPPWQQMRRWGRREPVLAAHVGGLAIILLLTQAIYLSRADRDLAYHLKVSGLLAAWMVACWGLQLISRVWQRPDWLPVAWSTADVGFLTGLLYLLVAPLGLLFSSYHVLISAAGLFFRTRLVAATAVLSIVGSSLLLWLRPAAAGPWHYGLFLETTLALTGLLVGYQVWRLGILRDYYEERRPRW